MNSHPPPQHAPAPQHADVRQAHRHHVVPPAAADDETARFKRDQYGNLARRPRPARKARVNPDDTPTVEIRPSRALLRGVAKGLRSVSSSLHTYRVSSAVLRRVADRAKNRWYEEIVPPCLGHNAAQALLDSEFPDWRRSRYVDELDERRGQLHQWAHPERGELLMWSSRYTKDMTAWRGARAEDNPFPKIRVVMNQFDADSHRYPSDADRVDMRGAYGDPGMRIRQALERAEAGA